MCAPCAPLCPPREEKQAKDAAGIKSKQVKTEVALTGEAKPVEPQAAQEKAGTYCNL